MTALKYHTGFALSGGFIRGIAHLGMLQALFENNIRPDILSGTSAGAIASAFITDGREPFEVMELFAGQSFINLAKIHPSKESLLRMDYFTDFLKKNLRAKRIEDLQMPVVITATDFDNGKSIHFTQGELTKRIAASCCIPVLFKPVVINKVHYVDGGVFMNIPVSPIRPLCEKVLALNVFKLNASAYSQNIVSIALRAYHFMFEANTLSELSQADLVIAPDGLENFANYQLDKTEDIFSLGYFAALKAIEEQAELRNLKNYNKEILV